MAALVTAVADLDPAGEADGSVCGARRPAFAGGARLQRDPHAVQGVAREASQGAHNTPIVYRYYYMVSHTFLIW